MFTDAKTFISSLVGHCLSSPFATHSFTFSCIFFLTILEESQGKEEMNHI